ncbi:MAG: TonB-dependent receptor [Acidobacteria bacterium]|nr:TonB-dependent receptor [Acidobacteriota bacterium]
MRSLMRYAVVVLAVLVTVTTATAQTFTGGLRGAVRDANGVIPGVTVQLINEATNVAREVASNEEGLYNFAAVPPGTYTVRASLTGFRSYEQTGIRVGAQQFVTVDVTMEVGALAETITVTGEAPLIDTSTASTGAVINTEQLNTLPSGGRSAFLFAVTVPTVVASGDSQFNRQQDQTNASLLSLGGGTRRGNNYLVDGVPVTDLRNRSSANPSIEALEDVAVQVHTYDAETGRTGGGIFNTATKSGGNRFAGSGFYQARPRWGMANNFFSGLQDIPLPETYFHLGGGGFGGPILQNRTFFWFAAEGYGSNTTRNGALRFPTSRERNGDFSQTFDSAGRQVVIYDPLTGDANGNGRQPFPGNIIPAERISNVGRALANTYPSPTRDISNGSNNFESTAEINDRAQMYTGKVDHKFSDKVSLSGFYLYNKTDEPCANYWEPGLNGPTRYADPGDYLLLRRVHMLALNNTWLPSNNTVLTLRYGQTGFVDDDTLSIDFDPSTLGFSSAFLNQTTVDKYPQIRVNEYGDQGAIDPTPRNWYSWSANGTLTRLAGRHTLKAGLDYRLIGIDTQSFSGSAGFFYFDRYYTSANPLSNGVTGTAPSGNALASLLLGYPTSPSSDPGRASYVNQTSPFDASVHYFGGYVQDDWRLSPRTTVNVGLRIERETGLTEENNGFTVAFDRELNPGGQLGTIVNPLTGQPIRGGLVYAGVDGANEYQGNPPALKWSPRVGFVHSFNPRTVLRAGYGVYWAPWNYQGVGAANYGNIGFSQQTFIQQNQFVPTANLANAFPNGVLSPVGNQLGGLAGVGSQIEFIDQDKRAPYVQQYSIDINRELPGNMAIGFEYSGATGRDLGLGGSNDGIININQVPTQHLALGAALNDLVPNPFFGLPNVVINGVSFPQGKNVTSPTIQRRELLRPFPQFNNILMRQSTLGRSQYHAAIVKFDKRMSNGWGGRINYTFSRLEDDQFGETNFFSTTPAEAQDSYNLDYEYGLGLLDVPHKLVISPIVELPFGQGKRWATSGIANVLLGNWTLSSIISLESGFPTAYNTATASPLFSRTRYPNIVNEDGAETDGSRHERISPEPGTGCVSGQECGIGIWLDSSAFAQPGLYELGNASRTNGNIRTPHRNNWDFVASKGIRFGGSVRGQLRLEVLNVTNTVKVRGPNTTVGNAAFGQIRTQSGFMRLTQLMFRMTF